jgi:hypothetical protein
MEQTECFQMSAYKIQAPGNYPEESIQHLFYFPQNYIYFIILYCLLKLYIFSQTVDCNLNTLSCQLTVKVYLYSMGSHNVVTTVTTLQVGWSGVQFPAGVRSYMLLQNSQIGSGADPASYSVDTRCYFHKATVAGVWSKWLVFGKCWG